VADPTTTAALVSASASRVLTRAEFHGLAEMPAELEGFANIDNPRTRRAYRNDIEEFSRFVGTAKPEAIARCPRWPPSAWPTCCGAGGSLFASFARGRSGQPANTTTPRVERFGTGFLPQPRTDRESDAAE
jgi:hypothetical protein